MSFLPDFVDNFVNQVSVIHSLGKQVIVVSSGAIGMGAGELNINEKLTDIKMRQACAAIGQPILMHRYKESFSKYNVKTAQVLLTSEVLSHRSSYLNLRNSIETLLSLNVVPVINENDSVSTQEIGNAFGDNDKLSALIASKIDAELLIILSDTDKLYDKDPKKFSDAKPIHTVKEITQSIIESAGNAGSTFSTGGMKTKISAVQIAEKAGCSVVLAHGKDKNVIPRIINGENIGTYFHSKKKIKNRTRWILNSVPQGNLIVDEGAINALLNKKSLLPKGITAIEGVFEVGSVVTVNEKFKIVTSFNSTELESIIGKHSNQIREIFGKDRKDVVATPEDIVIIS